MEKVERVIRKKNGFVVETCPYCGFLDCEAEWCDVGVGYVQMGPHHCTKCGAFEIGPNDRSNPSKEEKRIGWYSPSSKSLPDTVSTIDGALIDSATALGMYRTGLVDHVPFHVTADLKPINTEEALAIYFRG
jgi:hypothetical protein